jgi:hypothetical protein
MLWNRKRTLVSTRTPIDPDPRTAPPDSPAPPMGRTAAPVVVLLLLSPIIGEVLFGATRITTLFVLIPQVGTWGCAALLIRGVVRHRRRGWPAILLLGLALAVAEECVIQQTSLAPLVGADPEHPYGRALGVNWVYFLWALGYETVWVVVLPIQLTELIFPARRDEPWLGRRGIIISSVVFLLASFVAWYSWTQVFVPRFFPELASYRVPLTSIVAALAVIGGLTVAALIPRPSPRARAEARGSPRPWLVGMVAFGLGLPWFGLVVLAYGAARAIPPVIAMLTGLSVAGIALSRFSRWSRTPDWDDSSRLASISGALLASMMAGFPILILGDAPSVDVFGKLALNIVAVWLLIGLARRMRLDARNLQGSGSGSRPRR